MFVAGKNVNMFTAALPLFFKVHFVKKIRSNILPMLVYVLLNLSTFH